MFRKNPINYGVSTTNLPQPSTSYHFHLSGTQGESYEAVGADFLDAKDGLTLIALEEGGVPRYHWERFPCHAVWFVKVAGVKASG